MRVRVAGLVTDARSAGTGLIALVGITGEWSGSGVFCCSPFASLINSRMLGTGFDRVRQVIDDVLDAVAKVAKMMIGNVRNSLESIAGPLAIGVPTVIHGRNSRSRHPRGTVRYLRNSCSGTGAHLGKFR